jgi:hypothetical protein
MQHPISIAYNIAEMLLKVNESWFYVQGDCIYVAGTTQLVLSGGNVGIGFTSPATKLGVDG